MEEKKGGVKITQGVCRRKDLWQNRGLERGTKTAIRNKGKRKIGSGEKGGVPLEGGEGVTMSYKSLRTAKKGDRKGRGTWHGNWEWFREGLPGIKEKTGVTRGGKAQEEDLLTKEKAIGKREIGKKKRTEGEKGSRAKPRKKKTARV